MNTPLDDTDNIISEKDMLMFLLALGGEDIIFSVSKSWNASGEPMTQDPQTRTDHFHFVITTPKGIIVTEMAAALWDQIPCETIPLSPPVDEKNNIRILEKLVKRFL